MENILLDEFIGFVDIDDCLEYEYLKNNDSVIRAKGLDLGKYTYGDTKYRGVKQYTNTPLMNPPARISKRYIVLKNTPNSSSEAPLALPNESFINRTENYTTSNSTTTNVLNEHSNNAETIVENLKQTSSIVNNIANTQQTTITNNNNEINNFIKMAEERLSKINNIETIKEIKSNVATKNSEEILFPKKKLISPDKSVEYNTYENSINVEKNNNTNTKTKEINTYINEEEIEKIIVNRNLKREITKEINQEIDERMEIESAKLQKTLLKTLTEWTNS